MFCFVWTVVCVLINESLQWFPIIAFSSLLCCRRRRFEFTERGNYVEASWQAVARSGWPQKEKVSSCEYNENHETSVRYSAIQEYGTRTNAHTNKILTRCVLVACVLQSDSELCANLLHRLKVVFQGAEFLSACLQITLDCILAMASSILRHLCVSQKLQFHSQIQRVHSAASGPGAFHDECRTLSASKSNFA